MDVTLGVHIARGRVWRKDHTATEDTFVHEAALFAQTAVTPRV